MPKTVTSAFDELLSRLALTDDQTKVASARHRNLRDFLSSRFALSENPWLTGSYSRQTIVRHDRDIDVMAAFSAADYWNTYQASSSGMLQLVRDALNRQYGSSKVSRSGAAVVMEMTTFNVDVVPVFARSGGGYLVADGSRGWKATNPPYHFELMKKRNSEDSRLKPLVKILKYWNICNDDLIQSFHLEMMIEKMWRDKSIGSYPHGTAETLRVLPSWLNEVFDDPWEPGGRLDSYLVGDELKRAIENAAADAKSSAAAEKLRAQGEHAAAFLHWQKVFRHGFPAYG